MCCFQKKGVRDTEQIISVVHTIKLVWNLERILGMFLEKRQIDKGKKMCLENSKFKLQSTQRMLAQTDVNSSKWVTFRTLKGVNQR